MVNDDHKLNDSQRRQEMARDQYVNNLAYVSAQARAQISDILDSPSVHQWTKDIIKEGLHKDCVGAAHDVALALTALRLVQAQILNRG